MKVGDLVMLSSYGLQRGYNQNVWAWPGVNVGYVTAIKKNYSYPIEVRWFRPEGNTKPVRHTRRELKYASWHVEGRS